MRERGEEPGHCVRMEKTNVSFACICNCKSIIIIIVI